MSRAAVAQKLPDSARSRRRARPEARRSAAELELEPLGVDSDATLYWLILAVGIIPVLVAVLRGGVWGVAPTVGAAFCIFALRALFVARVVRFRPNGSSERG